MKTKNLNGTLQYPDNVVEAAVIAHLDIENILQEFIDGTSFYSFYSQKIHNFNNQINDGVLDLIEQYNHAYSPVEAPDSHVLSTTYLKQIHALKSNSCLTEAEKIAAGNILMKQWEQETSALIQLPAKLMLEQHKSLQISFEFNMMCALCRMKPVHALAAFLDQISLARVQAYNQFNHEISFKRRPYVSDQNIPSTQPEIRKKYEKRFTALHNRMNRVKSFDRRFDAYQAFYKQWYQELLEGISNSTPIYA